MAASKPKSAAVYARISKEDRDPVTGQLKTLKVEDQVERCRAWAKANGWQLADFVPEAGESAPKRRNGKRERPPAPVPDAAGEYVDNDVSASKARPRPQYVVMLRDVVAGRIDGIISLDTDRLTRTPAELEHVIALHDAHGVQLATPGGGYIDLTEPEGILRARIMGNVAAYEVAVKAKRQKRANEARAAKGLQYGGMKGDTRPFGWEEGGMVLRKAEADQVADAIDQLLKKANFRPIVDKWNREGLPTARGGPWTLTSARQVLTRWRNAAIVSRNGVPVAAGNWEPIVTPEKLVDIRELFDGRKQGKPRATGQYLLSNIAVCGRCGSTVRHGMSYFKDNGRTLDVYRCNNRGGGANCGVAITRAVVDEAVIKHVVTELFWPDSAIQAQTGEDLQKVKTLRKQKAELEAEADATLADKSVSRSRRLKVAGEIEEEIRDIEAELARLSTRDALASLLLDLAPPFKISKTGKMTVPFGQSKREKEIRARFEALDLGAQRSVVRAVCRSITILPHPPGTKPTPQSARERVVIVGVGEEEQSEIEQ
jgi:site-specific DNA recombinase